MNKIRFLSMLLFFVLVTSEAEASLKTDISAFASRVASMINNTVESVKVEINTAAQEVQEWYTGSKVKSTIETVRALTEDVLSAASTIQDEYEETMDNVEGIENAAEDLYEREMGEFEDSQTGRAVELSQQLNDINEQLDNRKEVLLTEVTAKSAAAQENMVLLQAMYNETTDEAGKAQIQTEMDNLQNEINQYNEYAEQISSEGEYLENDGEYSSLQEERKEILEQLADLSLDVGGSLVDKFGDLFSGGGAARSAEYNKVIEENFLLEDEEETAENVARVQKHRQDTLISDVVHAFYASAVLKLELDEDLERIKRKKDNIAAVDYKITSVNLLIDQRIEDIDILYNYTNLMVADLRLKTSLNMIRQKYRLEDYEKDPAVLNLDNYIFTKEDVPTDEGQTSFLDSVTGE